MPNGDDYQHEPTLVELAKEAEQTIENMLRGQENLIKKIEKLEEENDKLRELLMTKVMDFKK